MNGSLFKDAHRGDVRAQEGLCGLFMSGSGDNVMSNFPNYKEAYYWCDLAAMAMPD